MKRTEQGEDRYRKFPMVMSELTWEIRENRTSFSMSCYSICQLPTALLQISTSSGFILPVNYSALHLLFSSSSTSSSENMPFCSHCIRTVFSAFPLLNQSCIKGIYESQNLQLIWRRSSLSSSPKQIFPSLRDCYLDSISSFSCQIWIRKF
jgi:hypothetical protein